jgi:hypothetical protein
MQFTPGKVQFFLECQKASSLCIRSAHILVAKFLNAKHRNGLSAHVMVRNTTESARKKVDQHLAEWIASAFQLTTV